MFLRAPGPAHYCRLQQKDVRVSSSTLAPHRQRRGQLLCHTSVQPYSSVAFHQKDDSSSSSSNSSSSSSSSRSSRKSRVQHETQQSFVEPLPNAVSFSVMGAGIFVAIPFMLMMLKPRAVRVRLLMRSFWTFAPLAVAYMGLLAYSYTPDMLSLLLPGSLEAGLSGFNPQFFPKLSGIQQLFKGPATIASIILHILSINLFLGRGIYFDGLSSETPTRHSLLATFLLGPTGLLVHWLTKAIYSACPHLRKPEIVVRKCNGGTITLLPYD